MGWIAGAVRMAGIGLGGALVACGGGAPGPAQPSAPAVGLRVVDRTLDSIARLQDPEGGWASPAGLHDLAVSGLAVLAFLHAGYTNRGDLPFNAVVTRGLRRLKQRQRPDGRFVGEADERCLVDHALAAFAMTQAYAMTGSDVWRVSAQRALDFSAGVRLKGGVWRDPDRPLDEDEAATTVWTALPFATARAVVRWEARSGKQPSLRIDSAMAADLSRWIDSRTDPATARVPVKGRTDGPGGLTTDALTAACAVLRFTLGEDAQDKEILRKVLLLLADSPPAPDAFLSTGDAFRAYFGSLATSVAPGTARERWRMALFVAVEAGTEAPEVASNSLGLSAFGFTALATLRSLSEPPYCSAYGYGEPDRRFDRDPD